MTHTPALDSERLAALVFELASQLHAERGHRLALEWALERAGVVTAADLEAAARDAGLAARGRSGAEDAIARLMRVIVEPADPRTPLRAEVAATAIAEHPP